jgi:hypothetical protein
MVILPASRFAIRRRTDISQSNSAMNKRQLIEDIRRYNVSAQPRFLAQFDENALKQYLEHLEAARLKRTRTFGSVRRDAKLRLVS